MSIDYSQFYVGTSSINSYGNSAYKKDTLVKYEFNTTDKYGNKIMDKMSREETIQAMKDIRSQYGDNVIVEFSGDGMAALVENRKGQVDEAITDEQREAKAERDAAFANEILQNEHREVAPEHMESKLDYVKIMHEKQPARWTIIYVNFLKQKIRVTWRKQQNYVWTGSRKVIVSTKSGSRRKRAVRQLHQLPLQAASRNSAVRRRSCWMYYLLNMAI